MPGCCLTFDVDMTASKNGKTIFVDEFQYCFDSIQNILRKFPRIRTTWFIRLDQNMEEIYGRAEYMFSAHLAEIEWLKEQGHEIAWHIHPYIRRNGAWMQNADLPSVLEEVYRFFPVAERYGIAHTVRFGWGYQASELMALLSKLGCRVDSSAIPRPRYSWANQNTDWSLAPREPYRPSASNYQEAGEDLNILEVPMTTAVIPASYDNGQRIYRYINPAYHHDIFQRAMQSVKGDCVLITHPAEVSSLWDCPHELLSYNAGVFYANIESIYDQYSFYTIGSLVPTPPEEVRFRFSLRAAVFFLCLTARRNIG